MDTDFQDGHETCGVFYYFPHICPGSGCAVNTFIVKKNARLIYEMR